MTSTLYKYSCVQIEGQATQTHQYKLSPEGTDKEK